jgi:hypothetical protein
MATITATSLGGSGQRTMTRTTLTGTADTFTYTKGAILVLENPTGGALSPTITGASASSSIPVPGYGTVSAASGYAVGSIASGAAKVIPLDSISAFLTGAISITSGTGLVAALLSP